MQAPAACEPIFVARQPIFTSNRELWGYELLFRNGQSLDVARCPSSELATHQVIADGYQLAVPGIAPGIKVCINFPRDLLLEELPLALPPETSVIEILEDTRVDDELMERVRMFRENGYIISLDDFVGQPHLQPLVRLSDVIKVDVLAIDRDSLEDLVQRLKVLPCTLLAEKVETMDMFFATQKMGFELFQGFFFSRPVVIPGFKLASSQLSRVKLLAALSQDDWEMNQLADIIKGDVGLSYRLLQFINSAHFCFPNVISSILGALNLLGRRKALLWLRVTIFADLGSSCAAKELIWLSVYRARFLELMAEVQPTILPPDAMFIMGLFSFLDVMLRQPMPELLERVTLEDKLKQAILDPFGSGCVWVHFLHALEHARWEECDQLLQQAGVDAATVARISAHALAWTGAMLGHDGPSGPDPEAVSE
ncbi:diguanylate phosphodiesterase [Desulfoplanes formicivorans]|uniref:Diguanylate phosphodiesterase n=2 Tax=Desulfoplanes formicivorans TaxID=1592317 RepID=A0A194AJ56_9BACT|nr:diguanylate phosphodiesterase [Desulfoplanes formicivorans]